MMRKPWQKRPATAIRMPCGRRTMDSEFPTPFFTKP
jgi:hypothetical protein